VISEQATIQKPQPTLGGKCKNCLATSSKQVKREEKSELSL
jgi:hypothetical protein